MAFGGVPERIAWTVELIAPRPADRVLEVGCGAGHAISLLCRRLRRGSITAIDRSATQVERARARNETCVAAGTARIERASLTDAPARFGERAFTKAFAVNVNAFWTQPGPSFETLAHVLRPGGSIHLAYEPPSDARLRQLRRLLPALLHDRGFVVRDVHVGAPGARLLCVVSSSPLPRGVRAASA